MATAEIVSGLLFFVNSPSGLLSAHIEGEWIVFAGGIFGEHRISRSVSTPERVAAHWRGYVSTGFAVSLDRGV